MTTSTPGGHDQPLADLDQAFSDIDKPPAGSAQPPDGFEKRKHKRKVIRSTAQIRTPSGELHKVHTLDISEGGLSVVASVNPKPKATCFVLINIPVKPQGGSSIEVQAIVVDSIYSSSESGFRIGFQFSNLSHEASAAITQFINT